MKKITLLVLLLAFYLNGICQNSWSLSMSGFDQTFVPRDFITTSNGDIYLASNKLDNTTSQWVYKIFKSTNQGNSWSEVSTTGLINLTYIHSLTVSGNKMVLSGANTSATNSSMIFTSIDNGSSWSLSMSGYDQTFVPRDFITTSNGDIYLACNKLDNTTSQWVYKIFKSTNQGNSWSEVSTTGLTNLTYIHSLTVSGNKMVLSGVNTNSTNSSMIFISDFSNTNTRINEAKFDDYICIYPNPFFDNVSIDLALINDQKPESIKLVTVEGKELKQFRVAYNSTTQIELDNLAPGVYFIAVDWASETRMFKVIKN